MARFRITEVIAAAVLATGAALSASNAQAVIMFNTITSGVTTDVDGASLNRVPFDFSTVAVEDVQFPTGGTK